jgi:hypothetical protein
MKIFSNCIMVALLALFAGHSMAGLLPGEGIVRDPVTGNYTATFVVEGEDGKDWLETGDLETATKIDPTVRSKFKLAEGWNIRYAYTIRNGSSAKQAINHFDLYGLPINVVLLKTTPLLGSGNVVLEEFFDSAMTSPSEKWSGSGARNGQTLNIGWMYERWDYSTKSHNTAVGIQPGESASGFGFAGPDLPGIFVAKLTGNTPYHHFDFSGPGPSYTRSDIGKEMAKIANNDFIPRNVAAPLIIVPHQFDAAVVMESIRTHVATWPARQLADSAFAAQLDRYLGTAAESFRLNNPKAAREHIHTLRKMLAKEHHHVDHDDEDDEDTEEHKQTTRRSIDRLAARVLDFDLRYVLKRTEHDHEEGDRKKGR